MIYIDFLNIDTQRSPGQFNNIKDLRHHAISLNYFSSLERVSYCSVMWCTSRWSWIRGREGFELILQISPVCSKVGTAKRVQRDAEFSDQPPSTPPSRLLFDHSVMAGAQKKWTQAQGSHGYTEVRFKAGLFAAFEEWRHKEQAHAGKKKTKKPPQNSQKQQTYTGSGENPKVQTDCVDTLVEKQEQWWLESLYVKKAKTM